MKDRVVGFIENFVYKRATVHKTRTQWKRPLVGFAAAGDPLFLKLKEIVDKNHIHPTEALSDAKTVIVYFIPFQEKVVNSNANKGVCSEDWAYAYIETNELIVLLNSALSLELDKYKIKSFILPPTHNFDKDNLLSDWSHKHVAYISGLGTFGLHQMLITRKGACGRLGSMIIDRRLEPTARADYEYCLYKRNKNCKQCVKKCTFGALSENSFDRRSCYNVCLENESLYSNMGSADVCGKCVCNVSCSFKVPELAT